MCVFVWIIGATAAVILGQDGQHGNPIYSMTMLNAYRLHLLEMYLPIVQRERLTSPGLLLFVTSLQPRQGLTNYNWEQLGMLPMTVLFR